LVVPSPYRLALVVDGERVIGYDNERGKGDHKHCASALTKVDPPVLKIIDPPSAQFLRFTSSASALTSANTNWPTLCTLYQPIA
jgi:hypothetical protein